MELVTTNIDHLGLVAGMCDEIGLVEQIDRACGDQDLNKNLSFGQCVKCMIMNGLGFVGRTLYLYSEYFEDKPLEHLIGVDVSPEQIDNNVLGRTLDKLFSLGVTDLFSAISLQAVKSLGIKIKSLHLDSTSFHVDGEYNSELEQDDHRIKITRGYSRDHRPELNQVVLQLITSNEGNIPLFMQAASGNVADKTAFSEIVSKHISSFQAAVKNRYIVGDSALYTPSSIQALKESDSLFVTRVPSQLSREKEIIKQVVPGEMDSLCEGYKGCETIESYGGMTQRWVVVFSEAAHHREVKTLKKNFLKGGEKELKEFKKLCKEVFSCPKDAESSYKKALKKFKYLSIKDFMVSEVQKHSTSGRPKKGKIPQIVGYQIKGVPCSDLATLKELEQRKGFFVLATNDMDKKNFSMQEVLQTYKAQQSVERGFRFLKSPDFLVSSLFLKKPERIEALLMVMTLCLLVYAAVEHKVRTQLKEKGDFFPNQLKKPAQNPTSRWIFFCFLGLHVVFINGEKHSVTNLKERHRIILHCLGPPYQRLYYSEMW